MDVVLVRVDVEVPQKLSEESETLLRQLAEIEKANVSPHRRSFLETLKDWFAPDEEPEQQT